MATRGRCSTTVDDVQCGDEGAAAAVAGCVHEHVTHGYVCTRHLAEVEARGMLCILCEEAGHDCRYVLRVVAERTERAT